MLQRFNSLFPAWAILLSLCAYYYPNIFISLKPSIIYLLAIVMFAMGITLTINDLKKLLNLKLIIFIGLLLQFSIMPFAAWSISTLLGLSLPLLTGMLLVGSCPGGTASNVICYLANGNLALSILLTCCSTVLSVFLTPLIIWLYIGESIEVPVFDMMFTVFKIIIIPVSLGILINYIFGKKLSDIVQILPTISITTICIIIATIVALNHDSIGSLAGIVIIAVVAHNLVGMIAGYWIARGLKFNRTISKTLAIEVGMQNSGLAVALASEFFKPLSALPGAIFSIWHNLSGSIAAGIWSRTIKTNSGQEA